MRFVALALALSAAPVAAKPAYIAFDINNAGQSTVTHLKAQLDAADAAVVIEAEDQLIALVDSDRLQGVAPRQWRVLDITPDTKRLFVVREAHKDTVARLESDVIARGGRQAVVKAKTAYLESIKHASILALGSGAATDKIRLTLASQAVNQAKSTVHFPGDTGELVAQVNGDRWRQDLQMLVTFNRYSHGPDLANARDHLVEAFAAIPGLTVSTDSFRLGSSTLYNVLARLPGVTRPNDVIVVGAHYDAISQSPQTAAPGAEDNGSGTAGLLELARVLASARPAATILFIAYAGEEQGLYGSYDHVRKLRAAGQLSTIKAVYTMDMIAYTSDADLAVLLESDQRGANAIFPGLTAAANTYTSLRVVTSLNPWGSDHVPYIEAGVPSMLTIDNDWDSYPAYHKTTDTIDKTSQRLATEILKMQVAAIWAAAQ